MSATVDVQTKQAKNIVTVPIQSVTTRSDSSALEAKGMKKSDEEDGDIVIKDEKDKSDEDVKELIQIEECVFVYSEGKAKMVKVKTGIQDNNYIQIVSGLNAGDEIISGPYSAVSKQLKDGMEVIKVDKSELFNANKK
jgi:HlyD family secretion protein